MGSSSDEGEEPMSEDEVNRGLGKRLRKALAGSDDAAVYEAIRKIVATCGPDEPEEDEGEM